MSQRDKGRLVSPAPQCLDKLRQQGAEDSAQMKQDAGSTQSFKENLWFQAQNLSMTAAVHINIEGYTWLFSECEYVQNTFQKKVT